jgi:hypothetical protein
VQTDDGFEVTLEQDDFSFIRDSYILKVRKVIKYGWSQVVPGELAEDPEFLEGLINQMKQRIEDRVNCGG